MAIIGEAQKWKVSGKHVFWGKWIDHFTEIPGSHIILPETGLNAFLK